MICMSCRNEFISGTCLTCGVHALMGAERESCRDQGRREMLWRVYCAAMCGSGERILGGTDMTARAMDMGRTCGLAEMADHALRQLAALGDESARRLLEGER